MYDTNHNANYFPAADMLYCFNKLKNSKRETNEVAFDIAVKFYSLYQGLCFVVVAPPCGHAFYFLIKKTKNLFTVFLDANGKS